jgi:hypothetical protein
LEALSAAINLALPLEERSLPRHRIIPRYYTRRLAATQQEPTTQQEVDTSHLSNGNSRRRAVSNLERTRGSGNASMRSTGAQQGGFIEAQRPRRNVASQGSIEGTATRGCSTTASSDPPSRQPATANRPPLLSGLDSLRECAQETQQDDGKWRPPHRWTMARDILYAQRCTTILCGDTPRQSDLIIKDGKRWKIDWAEERLVPQKKKAPRLPKYGEITKAGAKDSN